MLFQIAFLPLGAAVYREIKTLCLVRVGNPLIDGHFRSVYCSGTEFCCDKGCCPKPENPLPGGIPAEVWPIFPILIGLFIGVMFVCIYKKCCGPVSADLTRVSFPSRRRSRFLDRFRRGGNSGSVRIPFNLQESRNEDETDNREQLTQETNNRQAIQEINNTNQLTLETNRQQVTQETNRDQLRLETNRQVTQERNNGQPLTPPPSYDEVTVVDIVPSYEDVVKGHNK